MEIPDDDEVVDVEFEKVIDVSSDNGGRPSIPEEFLGKMPERTDRLEISDEMLQGLEQEQEEKEREENFAYGATLEGDAQRDPYLDSAKTLFDLSLDSGDPRWKKTRIPFCKGMEYIDGKLAFLTEIDGMTYGIGMPFDHAVAIIEQTPKDSPSFESAEDTQIRYINPDKYEEEEDSQELMEVMAKQVQETLGDDLMLRKTPKVLTISGDLNKYTDNWEMNLMDKPVAVDDLMEGMDDFVKAAFQEKEDDAVDEAEDKEMAEFYAFMRSELGDEEFEKTLNEEMPDEDKALAKMFEFELSEDMFAETPEDDLAKAKEEALSFHPDSDGVALKLIAFEFGDRSKSYQLVKLLQPFPLLGKKIEEAAENGIRFELLTPQEEEAIIPKLQAACQEDLANAGMSLDDFQKTPKV